MIFTWIEQELSEGEPWSIFLFVPPYSENDFFDLWETNTDPNRFMQQY